MIIFFIALGIYILSAFLYWNYTRVAHSRHGTFYGISPDETDVLFTFMPLLNTVCAFMWILEPPKKKSASYKRDRLRSFFKIKD